nr:iron ABC transporter permease [uncultured Sphaerochaeta sp.]
METRQYNRLIPIYLLLLILVIGLALTSLLVGRYPISIKDIFTVIVAKLLQRDHGLSNSLDTILFNIRIPRILAAILVGAALATSGAAYQGIFKNPLVSPDILGASAGAGFGAALAIIFSFGILGIQIFSFLFALITVSLTYFISIHFKKSDTTLILILTGILTGTLFSSLTSLLKYIADPYEKLPAITIWLMGSLTRIRIEDIKSLLIPFALGLVPLLAIRWRLNVMAFGDEEAQALGIDTKRIRFITITTATILTASVVAISGVIGWVGLLVPHIARLIVGPNYRSLLPASLLLGSAYMITVDTLARILFPMEIPLGILTSIIGAPVFLYLLSKTKRGWV